MLKIKDNVDLKALEKYGFKEGFLYTPWNFGEALVLELDTEHIESIIIKNRTIYFYRYDELFNSYANEHMFDVIYDMINDGLVEKVKES